MKFFDHVSEDVQKVLQQVECLPFEVSWGYDGDSHLYPRPVSKDFDLFFIMGRKLGCTSYSNDYSKVSLMFTSNVPDGSLETYISTTGFSFGSHIDLHVNLLRGRDWLSITEIQFRTSGVKVSHKTVRYVQDWIRDKVYPYYQREKEIQESMNHEAAQLRDKYKP